LQTEIRKTKVILPGIMQTKLWQTTHGDQAFGGKEDRVKLTGVM
jgi:hypothetical protein